MSDLNFHGAETNCETAVRDVVYIFSFNQVNHTKRLNNHDRDVRMDLEMFVRGVVRDSMELNKHDCTDPINFNKRSLAIGGDLLIGMDDLIVGAGGQAACPGARSLKVGTPCLGCTQ